MLLGARKLALVLQLQQRRLRSGFPKNMTSNLGNCDLGIENNLGVLSPATDAYVAEAIEALKAGKIIAVPTDTLYGFACDAWYAI